MTRRSYAMPDHLRKAIEAAGGKVPSPGKYGNTRVGRYDSKLEANYAAQLEMRKRAANGDVLEYLEQVPVRLSDEIVYRVDFLVFFRDGTWRFVETKGFWTKEAKLKMRLLRERRPELAARLDVVGRQMSD